jgi:hypothetical protein
MKGDHRNSREKPENLDMDKHPVSLACGERRLKQNPGGAAKPREALFHGVAAFCLTPVGGDDHHGNYRIQNLTCHFAPDFSRIATISR